MTDDKVKLAMKSFLKVFLFFLITTSTSEEIFAQQVVWRQIIGEQFNEIAQNCIELRNGSYLMAGEKEISIPGKRIIIQKSYLVKIDRLGNILWEKLIGDSNISNSSLTLAEDESGNIYLPYRSDLEGHLVKLDSAGSLIWDKNYIQHDIIGFRGMSFVNNNKFIVMLGLNTSFTAAITKIDTSGNVIWSKAYFDSTPSFYIYDCHNNSFMFSNDSYYISGSAQGEVGFILKTDTSGNVIWNKRYSDNLGIFSIAQISESTLITSSRAEINGYLRCIKIDSSGNVVWSKSYSNDTLAGAIGYDKIIKASTNLFSLGTPSGHNFGRLMIIDSIGTILSSKFYYYPQSFFISQRNINTTSDSGYIVAGSLDSNNFLANNSNRGDKQIDALIFKIDKNGNTVSIKNINSTPKNFDLNSYPNPYNSSFNLSFNLISKALTKIELYDISGKLIKTIQNEFMYPGNYKYTVHTPELSSGIYFLKITNNDKSYSKKILLIK
ncbi:MAG: T9SS type A sorting domain-containing protein [Ignavibacteria bacterium]